MMDEEMKENVVVERMAIKETVQTGKRVLVIDEENQFYTRSKVKTARTYCNCQNRATAFTKESDPGFIYVKYLELIAAVQKND